MDIPNHRSLHTQPKPRTGGIAILLVLFIGSLIFQPQIDKELFAFFPYILLLAALAIYDDILSISPLKRFFLQILIAGLIVSKDLNLNSLQFFGIEINLPPVIGMFITILFIVWLINLYNFMDGMDGFAAGMAIFGFATFALLAVIKGEYGFAMANLLVVAAAVGFLLLNLPPSRIFMGDVGSTIIGMLVALFSLWAEKQQIFSLLVSLVIFTPFILDATVTLIKRLTKREKIWEAHRSHYYQRLVLLGWGHKKTLLMEYSWMLVCSSVGILLFYVQQSVIQLGLFALFAVLCVGLLTLIDKKTQSIRT